MALLNRRKQEKPVLPEEVQEYYQAERREKTGRAWLLALATLLVTFLIAAVLFFGGRWLYRVLFENDDTSNTTTSQTQNNTGTSSTNTDKSDTTDGEESDTDESDEDTVTTPQANGATNGSNKTPVTTPATGPDELVDTGPGDEL